MRKYPSLSAGGVKKKYGEMHLVTLKNMKK
jgi:hypothetical protein